MSFDSLGGIRGWSLVTLSEAAVADISFKFG